MVKGGSGNFETFAREIVYGSSITDLQPNQSLNAYRYIQVSHFPQNVFLLSRRPCSDIGTKACDVVFCEFSK